MFLLSFYHILTIALDILLLFHPIVQLIVIKCILDWAAWVIDALILLFIFSSLGGRRGQLITFINSSILSLSVKLHLFNPFYHMLKISLYWNDCNHIATEPTGKAGRLCDRDATACDKEHVPMELVTWPAKMCMMSMSWGSLRLHRHRLCRHLLWKLPWSLSDPALFKWWNLQNQLSGYTCLCHQNFTGKQRQKISKVNTKSSQFVEFPRIIRDKFCFCHDLSFLWCKLWLHFDSRVLYMPQPLLL